MAEIVADQEAEVGDTENKVETTATVAASCIAICEVSAECRYLWFSPSIKDILGERETRKSPSIARAS